MTEESARRAADGGECVSGFVPVCLSSLRSDTLADFDLYLRVPELSRPVLYRQRDLPFTEDVRQRLVQRGVARLYVLAEDHGRYLRYVESHLPTLLNDPSLPTETKTDLLYRSATNMMAEILEQPRASDVLRRSRDLVWSTCDYLLKDRFALQGLVRVMSFDYYTYTHSLNVFVFSVSLARRVGITDPDDIRQFGEGALLHDIGKSMIDAAIINFPGKLNAEQWDEVRKHPGHGYDLLIEQGVDNPRVLSVVRHHHEKLTGKGYPDGLKGDAIHRWVRIATIADIFDALTTRRAYKDALESFPALGVMRDEMGADLDPDLFRAFVQMMGDPTK